MSFVLFFFSHLHVMLSTTVAYFMNSQSARLIEYLHVWICLCLQTFAQRKATHTEFFSNKLIFKACNQSIERKRRCEGKNGNVIRVEMTVSRDMCVIILQLERTHFHIPPKNYSFCVVTWLMVERWKRLVFSMLSSWIIGH